MTSPTIRFIGDVHGKFRRYRELIRDVPASIQVGDMGVGFRRMRGSEAVWSSNPPFDAMARGEHFFIRGNHDNPAVCRQHRFWIEDGAVHNGVFCVGGAVSIDRAWRTAGLDWWPEEELSYAELDTLIERYSVIRPEIVCTHDCPESVAGDILAAFDMRKIEDGSRTRVALQRMLEIHEPAVWVFGHWHVPLRVRRGRTTFQCLAELEYVDVDLRNPL